MQGEHRTILTYFWGSANTEGDPNLEVGEVTCVPRVGDTVFIVDKEFIVKTVSWTPDTQAVRTTWATVQLEAVKKRKRRKR